MKRTLLLLALMVMVAGFCGCRSIETNSMSLVDDTARFTGLDRPSMLVPRPLVPTDYYTPYR